LNDSAAAGSGDLLLRFQRLGELMLENLSGRGRRQRIKSDDFRRPFAGRDDVEVIAVEAGEIPCWRT
jgi:hypothetical protein